MAENEDPMVEQAQEAWSRAIADFNEIETMEQLVAWAVKYVPNPELRHRAKRYARFPALCRNRILLEKRLLDPLFEAFREPYDDNFQGNMGIAIAPNSQAFSFSKIVDELMNDGKTR